MLSAKVFFKDNTNYNVTLIRRFEGNYPAEFVKRYKRNVAPITPEKTGWLKRSIITQVLGNRATIGWRAKYALAQEKGGHTVNKPIRGPNRRDGGYGTIMPGFYQYPRNAGFATKAFMATTKEMDSYARESGMVK